MRIAVIGAGVSGLVAAWMLHEEHAVHVFEAGAHPGGHANTRDVEQNNSRHAVDTGFVVYNKRNYPNFVRLLDRLGVASQPTSMSFSVRGEASGYEYCGTNLATLFAQWTNLLRPSHYRMLVDILRFNRRASWLVRSGVSTPTLGTILDELRLSRFFVDNYLVPMGSAIWSSSPAEMLEFPAGLFLRFLDNHGLLSINDQPEWRVISGGSRNYVERLIRPFRDRIRLNTPIDSLRRTPRGVILKPRGGEAESFDRAIVAVHADQALRMLSDPSERERELLSAFGYAANEVVLHTDQSLLPRRSRARASWNYHIPETPSDRAMVTYDMSRLQGLDTRDPFCLTLNRTDSIDTARVIERFDYAHPVFSPPSVEAQRRRDEIQGVGRVHYCGAYWGNGFHEDGVNSALHIAGAFGRSL